MEHVVRRSPNTMGLASVDCALSYSQGPEIHRYFRGIAEKYQLLAHIKLNHRISRAVWDDIGCKWAVTVEDTTSSHKFDDTCDILINGSGILK